MELRGYDADFRDQISKTYECPVCLLVLREPCLLSCCGVKVCSPCIAEVQNASSNPLCPVCRKAFTSMQDKQLQRIILGLSVHCSLKGKGCRWVGELRQLKEHTNPNSSNACQYMEVACKYSCGGMLPRHTIQQHERYECANRPIDQRLEARIKEICHDRISHLEEVLEAKYNLKIMSLENEIKDLKKELASLKISSQLNRESDLKKMASALEACIKDATSLGSSHAYAETKGDNSYSNLSPDVLVLMPKLKEIPGLTYFPEEGRVEVMATDPEEREKIISKFQEAYQNILSTRQFKTGTLELPPAHDVKDIYRVLAEFNGKYHQCHFSYNADSHSVKIISLSSRQFEQAKKLLKDQLSGRHPSSVPNPLQPTITDSCHVLVLSDNHILTVKKGDMIKEEADVIVNAANRQMKHFGGLAEALNKASHGELQKHSDVYIKKNGDLRVGEVAITKGGGQLKCKHVIHAVGPIASEVRSEIKCEQLIMDVILNTLKKAHSIKAVSIVLPAISTGVYAVDPKLVAKAMFKTITEFRYKENTLQDIRIVIIDEPTYACFAKELLCLKSIVSNNGNSIPKLERSLSDQGSKVAELTNSSYSGDPTASLGPSGGTITTQPSANDMPDVNYPSILPPLTTEGTAGMSPENNKPHPPNSSSSHLNSELTLLTPGKISNHGAPPGFHGNMTHSNNGPGCPVCLNSIATDPLRLDCCKATYCRQCLDQALVHSPFCPTCKTPLREVKGNQPPGTMSHYVAHQSLPGYPFCNTITITYRFNGGKQGPHHPNPGHHYSGTTRTAYLPNNFEGQEVLHLLRRAFDAGLLFTIGTSNTTGMSNAIVWNDVHHKTNTHGGPTRFGYPDETYLTRVKEELKAKGIY